MPILSQRDRVHLGWTSNKNGISVGSLHFDEESPGVERMVNDEP